MGAVGRAAEKIIAEVRRQLKEIPGLREGKAKPEYGRCVEICTVAAQREMLLPSAIAIAAPLIVGLLLGVKAAVGLLVGALISGFPLALMMANSGASWDNAKKYIEAGHYGGKRSLSHRAAVIGDTVGDPLKDTAGPSLDGLIKLMSMVSLVIASFILRYTLSP
jgi:K(+)-stimulated pyrophosphate-energized sodium pump